MMAREFSNVLAEWDLVHADAALGLAALALVGGRDRSLREGFDGCFGGRTRCVAGLVLFHELRYDAVESFLRVDCVACHAGWTEHVEQLGEGAGHTRHAWTTCDDEWAVWAGSEGAVVVEGVRHVVWVSGHAHTPATHGPAGCDTDVHHHLVEHLFDVVGLVLEWLGSIGVPREEVWAAYGTELSAAEVGVT
jgi:hypothetical protein